MSKGKNKMNVKDRNAGLTNKISFFFHL